MKRLSNASNRDPRHQYDIYTDTKHIHTIPPICCPPPRPNRLSRSRLEKLSSPRKEISMPSFMPYHNYWENSLRKRFLSTTSSLPEAVLRGEYSDTVLSHSRMAKSVSDVDPPVRRSTYPTSQPKCVDHPNMSAGTVFLEPLSIKVTTENIKNRRGKSDSHATDENQRTPNRPVQEFSIPLLNFNLPNFLKQEDAKHDRAFVEDKQYTRIKKFISIDMIRVSLQSCVKIILSRIHTNIGKRVALIQRSFRRHHQRLRAGVELNFLKLRRDEEPLYWAEVGSMWDQELLRDIEAISPLSEHKLRLDQKSSSLELRKCTTRERDTTPHDVDVYSYSKIGPLPESLLRKELEIALLAKLRRIAASALLCYTRSLASSPFEENTSKIRSNEITLFSIRSKMPPLKFPVFLPHNTFVAIMDNVCFIIGKFRNDSALLAHLKGRNKSIVSY